MTASVRPSSLPPAPAGRNRAELHTRPVPGESPGVYRMQVELAGVYVETDEAPPEGAIVNVHVSLPRQRHDLKTVARVAYQLNAQQAAALSRAAGVGLELLDVWGQAASDTVERALTDTAGSSEGADVLVGTRTLVVDDDAGYRQRAAQAMREAGCAVSVAHNGVEGLSVALREVPDLIISDVTMPGLDGWQLLRLLRTKNSLRNTPVIFLTDLQNEEDRVRGYRLGVDDYLAKPFTAEELTVRARRAVERSQSARSAGGLRGRLSEIPLATLLGLTEMEQKTGVIELTRAGEHATLYINAGRVFRIALDDRYDHLAGLERFFHVLDWEGGQFELSVTEMDEPDALGLRTSFVLLEHARRSDER